MHGQSTRTKSIVTPLLLNVNSTPLYFQSCAIFSGITLDYSIQFHNHIQTICTKLTRVSGILYRISLSYSGPQCWNSIAADIRGCRNVKIFKKKLQLPLLRDQPTRDCAVGVQSSSKYVQSVVAPTFLVAIVGCCRVKFYYA